MRKLLVFAALSFLSLAGSAGATQPSSKVERPAGVSGTVVVPDKFLRRWDPVTVFFSSDTGPSKGGAEDSPGKHVSMTPAHPGAFTWLDARTLQFRPAEPWPPLERFTWTVSGRTHKLTTLMAAPVGTQPSAEQTGLDPVSEIVLTFSEPMPPEALARMVQIELKTLPGIGGDAKSRWLDRDDFQVKPLERRDRADAAGYSLQLSTPIPLGVRAIVHLRLSLDDASTESIVQIAFSTNEPFRIAAAGCRGYRLPITPDGASFSADQALRCDDGVRTVVVDFSATPRSLGPLEGRNLVRFSPAVDGLTFRAAGRSLEVTGAFKPEIVYRVTLSPIALADQKGRTLEMNGKTDLHLFFPKAPAYLSWRFNQGVVERFGPQMLPLDGRGQERVDLRIHKVDPLDRDFWPFPQSPIVVDELLRPPGPGEEPEPHVNPDSHIGAYQIVEHIRALGVSQVSSIVKLPLKRDGRAATFGLDVEKDLAFVSGADAPGTYLVGIRRLDSGSGREWQRIQVTDLSLSTVEETNAVTFTVTSLSTGKPVSGASIKVEGSLGKHTRTWATLISGTTGSDGKYRWKHRAPAEYANPRVMRFVVASGADTLVLDPHRPPEHFADNQWNNWGDSWLQWTQAKDPGREPVAEKLIHLFTERPVYRPDEPVHIKGWVRAREKGELTPLSMRDPKVVVAGPGDLEWSYPVTMTPLAGFHHSFSESDLPTGTYTAWLQDWQGARYGSVSFLIEAYRLPTFEVDLHGPDRTPLDREFAISLSAKYYAGGRVVGRPVRWRVTQFPYTWVPERREGFLYSSDGRFSNAEGFDSRGTLESESTTDESGAAKLPINPAIEPTAAPRSYVVEATVVGDDDQTVTATRSVVALPPFVLGLKAPRYLEKAAKIEPEVIVVGVDGKPVSGQKVTVRLQSRQWHSHLTASDFSEGKAKYVTDVVDKTVTELEITSGSEPKKVPLTLPRSGVYLVELESRDSLGRAQVVTVDLYAGGDEPVTWTKPQGQVFQVASDKQKYVPGETATLVLKSPFQKGQALAIVEAPEGNRYEWLEVKNGAATFKLTVAGHHTPRIPVHFVLMRGRVQGSAPVPGSETDFGKPATLASTTWLTVEPVDNRVEVKLEHPERAQPGDKVKLTVKLTTPQGKPVGGEVALWLVDQAVLALGQEQRLDPLPSFITPVQSRLSVRDTRSMVIGWLPLSENPGGDGEGEGQSSEDSLLDKVTIRKKFLSVPYYEPALIVPSSGVLTVTVQLPDNLTNFKIRAKAASGNGRFGVGTGTIAVRLPLLVQPSLPRFVRPGDRFAATAIGRVVEGPGGEGRVEFQVDGMKASGDVKQSVTWTQDKPSRLEVPVEVLTPPYTDDGRLSKDEVVFRAAIERSADKARDAIEIRLPLREDRWPVVDRALLELETGKAAKLPPVKEAARPGTVKRSVLVSDQAGLVKMASGLDFLMSYPYGGTEQRIAKARGMIATKKFRDVLHQEQAVTDARLKKEVEDTLTYLESVIDTNGLVSYWPGSRGYVSLTAWTLMFLQEAKGAGFKVNEKTEATLIRTLEQALRSDYTRFIDGEAFIERAWALTALTAVGKFDAAYASELARKAKFLDQEGIAEVLLAYAKSNKANDPLAKEMEKELFDAIVFRLWQSREIYGGLQTRVSSRNALILPSETRTLAESMRALAAAKTQNPRLQVLTDALVTLGAGDGWGSTNADASALLALSEVMQAPFPNAAKNETALVFGTKKETLKTGPENPVGWFVTSETADGEITLNTTSKNKVIARAETSYMPLGDGSQIAAEAKGFVVSRELMKIAKDAPPMRTRLEKPGTTLSFAVGDVVEEHVQVVNPKQRHYVAIVVPLAAGMEPLNPALATAPPEAKASGSLTLQPSYVAFLDDKLAYFYDVLPAGTYDFYFRVRAQTPGSFIQPAAQAEMMYDGAVRGMSPGARIEVTRP